MMSAASLPPGLPGPGAGRRGRCRLAGDHQCPRRDSITMRRIALLGIGLSFLLAQPFTADAKGKGKGHGKGEPPGQARKAEVHEALARGESPSRSYRRPPSSVYRTWDRDRVYTWEDRRYRYSDGGWVIYID